MDLPVASDKPSSVASQPASQPDGEGRENDIKTPPGRSIKCASTPAAIRPKIWSWWPRPTKKLV